MTDYTLKCEQPTVKCRFVLKRVEEFQLYIDLTLPELNQVQKGNWNLLELWEEKDGGDKESYFDYEACGKLETENRNSNINTKWLPLKIEGEVR